MSKDSWENIEREYKNILPLLRQLESEAKHIIDGIEFSKIKINSTSSRVKEWDSFCRKVFEHDYSDPINDIQDFVGVRIVCLFESDIDKIGELIKLEFNVISIDDKRKTSDPGSFGYTSVHYIVKIRQDYKGPRYDKIKDIHFEIQVRTIAMHAWAAVSHHISYKHKQLPSHLEKDLSAISAALYSVDKAFEQLYMAVAEIQATPIQDLPDIPPETRGPITQETLNSYLGARFPGRTHTTMQKVRWLQEDLEDVGYTDLSQVARAVEEKMQDALKAEKEHLASRLIPESGHNCVGFLRLIMDLYDEKFRVKRLRSLETGLVAEYMRQSTPNHTPTLSEFLLRSKEFTSLRDGTSTHPDSPRD